MLNIKIDKQYKVKTTWDDLSFNNSLEISSMLELMPTPFRQRYLNEEKQDDISPDDLAKMMQFKLDYVSKLNGIPKEILQSVKADENGVDVNYLFDLCSKFMFYPDPNEIELKEFILIDGVKCYPVKEDVDSMGRPSNFQNADYASYAVGMTIQAVIEKIRNNDFRQQELTLLAACLFRPMVTTRKWFRTIQKPENYSYDVISKRAVAIGKLPSSQVYGAYFFLSKQLTKSLIETQSSLKNKIESQAKRLPVILAVTTAFIKWSIIGYFRRMKLRVMEYLK